jgi:glycosyltransferase involved in cell wall biosynthesis/GT2 family glycosyltransferase
LDKARAVGGIHADRCCDDTQVRISVVVPTYRRTESLKSCLDAIASQETAPAEVIIVIREDDWASRNLVLEHSAPTSCVEVNRAGVIAAMNAGVDASSGEVIALTDDDARPRPDWLTRLRNTYVADPGIAAVGGRDFVFHEGVLEDGRALEVGIVDWLGRVAGNHHLGVGSARDVDVLKGVNLSVRGQVLRELRFDERLIGVGTEHHWELALCLSLRRRGLRVVYDPAIAVDHHPQPRIEGTRQLDEAPIHVRNATHNATLALLEYLPPSRRALYLAWAIGIGMGNSPGVAHALHRWVSHGDLELPLLKAAVTGRIAAVRTLLRSRRPRGGRIPDPAAQDTILALGHSEGAVKRIEQLLAGAPGVRILGAPPGRRGMSFAARAILSAPQATVYLVDLGMSTTVAAILGRMRGKRVILDTGDAVYALARSLGDRGPIGTLLVGAGEQLALRSADQVVVRGSQHAALVPRPAIHIPDLAPTNVERVPAEQLRRELNLDGEFVIGLVGSIILSTRLGVSYGWDLVEAIGALPRGTSALIVGDGSGLSALRLRADQLGVADRCRFVGRIPLERVDTYISAMDAAISTQTNDVVGRVRTTAKLPLYLACGCPVLASHVGEAARLLGPVGWTLPYAGVLDRSYPIRLAEASERWRGDPAGATDRQTTALRIARESFDPGTMRKRLLNVLGVDHQHRQA